MIFTRKGLSHPGSRYGKGFMVALSLMTSLHVCNIATHVSLHQLKKQQMAQMLGKLMVNLIMLMQFLSFAPAIKYWVSTFNVNFSRLLLTAT